MPAKKKHTIRNQPATKGDVFYIVADAVNGLRGEMKQWKEEIINHFDVVAENIHRDVAGANRDEISALQDKVQQHDSDIVTIKQKVGIV